ncbi:hypothetical protein B5G52_08555 [Pseudoalteromonas sp. A601]|nr:hypothetical protein B5G52_08555 [Pseudoalteromonas sp. A601]
MTVQPNIHIALIFTLHLINLTIKLSLKINALKTAKTQLILFIICGQMSFNPYQPIPTQPLA